MDTLVILQIRGLRSMRSGGGGWVVSGSGKGVQNLMGVVQWGGGGGGHDLAKIRIPMIHRFMTSHPVAKLLLCFGAKHC